jgi:ribonuclease D
MTIRLHRGDLPDLSRYGKEVAIDTETMGLQPHRDRLCVVQLSPGDGSADVVQIPAGLNEAPNLVKLLGDPNVTKIFHYARFDIAVLKNRFGVVTGPVYCTKIASKLCRTYTDRHGLKDIVKELLNVDLSKQQQSSDWGAEKISEAQLEYAASDVLYLHDLKRHLDRMLVREGRMELARACFDFLKHRIDLDLLGWGETDIFAHS